MKYSKMNNGKLQITILGHKRIPFIEGVVEELSIKMVAFGHSVCVFTRKGNHISGKEYDSISQITTYKGIKRVFTINKRGLAALSSSIAAAIYASLGNYDVIHFHAEGPCAMLRLPHIM